jgi:hypothetical protein
MRATSVLLALLIAAGALSIMPSAAAAEPPIYCVMAPCGPQDPVPVPSCKPLDRHDGGIHTTVSSDCRTQVDIKTYDCVWNCGWHDVVRTHYLTIRQYGQNNGEASMSASAIELPDPCGPTAYCAGPECPAVDVSTTDFLAYLGPHASASTTQGCQATVEERGLRCAIGTAEVERTLGPVTVGADVCMPALECTCDPVDLASTSASGPGINPPPQCLTTGCCFAPCPAPCYDSCSPPGPVACKPIGVHTTDFLAYLGPHFGVDLDSDCSVDVQEHGLACPSGWDEAEVQRDVGPAGLQADTCDPVVYCTCDPLPIASASAAPGLPVQVEVVQCVTAPCPPQVTCTPATTAAPGFQVSRSRSCHVTITQDPLPCEGSRHESTTAGPVTVRRAYCGPGIEP